MTDSKPTKFWSSIPGLLTGTAGVVTAIVGLFTVLVQLDVIGKDSDKGPDTTVPGSTGNSAVTQPGGGTSSGSGGGVAPSFDLAPKVLAFDWLGTKQSRVTLRNTGAAPLTVASVQVAGTDAASFTVEARECTRADVPRGGTCSLTVSYAPPQPGNHTARVRVTVTGAKEVQEVELSGKRLL